MKEKNTMHFFVLGVNNEKRARYLARVIRTQEGVDSSVYNYETHILTVTFEPEVISLDYMKELAYFSDCKLITEEDVIENYCNDWTVWRRLEKIMFWEGLVLVLLLIYLFMGISLNFMNNILEYIMVFIVLTGFIISLVWRKKMKDKIEKGEGI